VSPVRAAALGYQGFGNVGDEAILGGIEALLADGPIRVETVIGGDRAPIPAFPTAKRVTSRRLLPTPAAARSLRRARLLIVSGGGLIHDHWPIVIPRYLAWSLLARSLGVRIAWVGVGVGPIEHAWARHAAAAMVRLAGLVTVRDEVSAAWVRRLVPGTQVHVVPDPAFFLRRQAPGGGGGTAIIVRQPVPTDAHLAPHLAQALAGFARARIATGGRVTILTMERGLDDAYAAEIARAVAPGAAPGLGIRAVPIEPDAALELLAGFDEAVSVRLHGLILCALSGTPCLPIGYDPKVLGTAARLGLADLAVPLAKVSTMPLDERLRAVAASTTQAVVDDAVLALRAEASDLAAVLASVASAS
jgi:polysaccharide pyruvyl transferase WcaK-like protein